MPVVFVPNLIIPDIPPSFVLKRLRDAGYRPIAVRGAACAMAMYREGASEDDIRACASQAETYMDAILDEFHSTHHPIIPEYLQTRIAGDNREVPLPYVERFLNTMESYKVIKRGKDSWTVTLDDRIRRVFEKSPDGVFTKSQVMRHAIIGGADRDAVDDILERLAKEGVITEVLKDKWTTLGNARPGLTRLVYDMALNLYHNIPDGRRRGMDGSAFLPYLERHLRDAGVRAERRAIAKDVVDRMARDKVWDGPA